MHSQLPRNLSHCLVALSILAAAISSNAKGSDGGRAASSRTAPPTSSDPRLNGGYKFNEGGWTYVHLEGAPEQVGFQHGYLLTAEIEDNVHVYMVTAPHQDKRPWSFFRDAGRDVLWPHLDPEYQAELKGIAEGLQAHGSTLDLWDIVALNGDIELSNYYLPMLNKEEGKLNPPAAVAPGKCSAFIATGSATKDGKIVIAHSNWSSYAEGERWTVVFDGWIAGRDYEPGRLWRERERADDYRDHATHGQGIRRGWDSGVRAIAQGDAVRDVDRRICRDHAQGQQWRLRQFVADWRSQDRRDCLPGTGPSPNAAY
jgi:hypothetical protein